MKQGVGTRPERTRISIAIRSKESEAPSLHKLAGGKKKERDNKAVAVVMKTWSQKE